MTDDRGAGYLVLPEGAELVEQTWRKSTVVPWNTFQSALQKTLGRRLMFVDTCHAAIGGMKGKAEAHSDVR